MTQMPQMFEAEISMLHVAGGAPRLTPPPGTLVDTAPRRAARGRKDDVFFVTLSPRADDMTYPGLLDQLAQNAGSAYFGTPRSVTAGLRAAADEINLQLMDLNESGTGPAPLHANLILGVLRGTDMFTAQCGTGQAILIRAGQVSRHFSEETVGRPLGVRHDLFIRYFHFEIGPDDLIILTTSPPPAWPDPSLSALSELTMDQTVDHLTAGREQALTGVVARMSASAGGEGGPIRSLAEIPEPVYSTEEFDLDNSEAGGFIRERRHTRIWRQVQDAVRKVSHAVQTIFATGQVLVSKLITRMAPGLAEPERPGSIPSSVLITTAVLVPVIVVLVSGVLYIRRGRTGLFQEYVGGAQAAIADAQAEPDPEAARYHWLLAQEWLELAGDYGESQEYQALQEQVQDSLDALDLITRLEFQPAVSGGFGPDAQLTSLVATDSDLYALDPTNKAVWHAWATGRGYEIDAEFECIQNTELIPAIGAPVGIAGFGDPAVPTGEGILTVDAQGMIVHCWPGETPVTGQLIEPDLGWGRIQAIEVFGDFLYLLDPESNAVWLYEATNGLFGGPPSLYFVDQVPELGDAIDLAKTQDELLILHNDGHLDRCQRSMEAATGGGVQVRASCDPEPRFQDERPGYGGGRSIPGALPIQIAYSPPPEPSIFILDSLSGNIYHYSMRLVYQAQYRPVAEFESPPSSLAFGPPNTLFLGMGDQVYYAQSGR